MASGAWVVVVAAASLEAVGHEVLARMAGASTRKYRGAIGQAGLSVLAAAGAAALAPAGDGSAGAPFAV